MGYNNISLVSAKLTSLFWEWHICFLNGSSSHFNLKCQSS